MRKVIDIEPKNTVESEPNATVKPHLKVVEPEPKVVKLDEGTYLTDEGLFRLDPVEDSTFVFRHMTVEEFKQEHNRAMRKELLRQNRAMIIASITLLLVCSICLPGSVYAAFVGTPAGFGLVATICYYTLFIGAGLLEIIIIIGSIRELHRIFKYELHKHDL